MYTANLSTGNEAYNDCTPDSQDTVGDGASDIDFCSKLQSCPLLGKFNRNSSPIKFHSYGLH